MLHDSTVHIYLQEEDESRARLIQGQNRGPWPNRKDPASKTTNDSSQRPSKRNRDSHSQ